MLIRRLLLVVATLGISTTVKAQDFPSRPIRVVVPFVAGGPTDVLLRVLGEGMAASLGQRIVVENRPGGGTLIGAEVVVRSPADGYTLFHAGSSTYAAAELTPPSFNPYTDLVGVVQFGKLYPLVMITNETMPVRSMAQLVAHAKATPGAVTFAYTGHGTPGHVIGELFNRRGVLPLTLISYKGQVESLNDLLGGRINLMFVTLNSVTEHVKSGKIRPLAAVGDERNPLAPDLPTLTEAGLSDVAIPLWQGLSAPTGTPRPVQLRLERAVETAVKTPQTAERMHAVSTVPSYLSGADFVEVIRRDTTRLRRLLEETGLKEPSRGPAGK